MTQRAAARPDRVVAELAAMLRPDSSRELTDPACGWEALLTTADEQRLLPALWSRFVHRGVQPLPPHLRRTNSPLAILHDAYDQNAARVADLQQQGEQLLTALAARDVAAIPLKGLHWLLADWLPDPAARVMVDIDLLVPTNRAATAVAVLGDAGHGPVTIDDTEGMADHEVITTTAAGRSGSVEIQIAPLVRRYEPVLPAADLRVEAASIDVCGRPQAVPSPTHGIVLAIAHAQLQDECHRLVTLPLRTLCDTAVLIWEGRVVVDWDEVAGRFTRAGHGRALTAFAAAADELFGISLPVPRRRGRGWVARSRLALRHPRAAFRYREIVTLPRALSAARMERLYRAHGPFGRAWARVHHVGRGAGRRLTGRRGR